MKTRVSPPPVRSNSAQAKLSQPPKKWSYFYLYVILDIFSRYVVGWMVADRENSSLAGRLIQQSCLKHGVQPQILTLHSDRGAPMTSQCTAQLFADLGVTRSLSRPQVSVVIYFTQQTHRYSCQSGVQDRASTVRVYARRAAYSTQGRPVASVGACGMPLFLASASSHQRRGLSSWSR